MALNRRGPAVVMCPKCGGLGIPQMPGVASLPQWVTYYRCLQCQDSWKIPTSTKWPSTDEPSQRNARRRLLFNRTALLRSLGEPWGPQS